MTVDLDLLRSFVTVAEEGSFRRGAIRLNLDQSALSRRIQKIESQLGFRLLERTTRDVSLTPAGARFYTDSAALLAQHERSVDTARRIADGQTGQIRIGYMAFAAMEIMPRCVAEFRKLAPEVDISMRYLSTQAQKIALAQDEIDIGFLIGPFDHPDMQAELLVSDSLHTVMQSDHPLSVRKTIAPRDLVGQRMILGDRSEWTEYRWRLEELLSDQGIELSVAFEASTTLALFGLIATGQGITIFPGGIQGVLGSNLTSRPIDHPAFRIRTDLVWKRANQSRQVQNFVRLARQFRAAD